MQKRKLVTTVTAVMMAVTMLLPVTAGAAELVPVVKSPAVTTNTVFAAKNNEGYVLIEPAYVNMSAKLEDAETHDNVTEAKTNAKVNLLFNASYNYFYTDGDYTLRCTLVDAETKKPLLDDNGKEISVYANDAVIDYPKGEIALAWPITANVKSLAGKKAVVEVTLTFNSAGEEQTMQTFPHMTAPLAFEEEDPQIIPLPGPAYINIKGTLTDAKTASHEIVATDGIEMVADLHFDYAYWNPTGSRIQIQLIDADTQKGLRDNNGELITVTTDLPAYWEEQGTHDISIPLRFDGKYLAGKAACAIVRVIDPAADGNPEAESAFDLMNGSRLEKVTFVAADNKKQEEPTKSEAVQLVKSNVSLSGTSFTYTGKQIKPAVKVTHNGKVLKKDTDYSVSYKNCTNAGIATVTVKGKGDYTGTVTVNYTIKKAADSITKATTKKTVSYSKLKKKPQSFQLATTVKSGTKPTYEKVSISKAAKKYITVSKAGKVTVKKGLKKGTYTVKYRVNVKESRNYKKASSVRTLKVTVK